uniref:Nudix hydrolase domain-containing protein n=1 Tax=Corethron hystrix TaxID=216773 RepID=A0A7S1FME9_9STRA|mmetsp:Transcript_12884/g.28457  ORF Transcript_12884/g.28457 Transcript_12884/m.28457 type:complete len:250 (+) Transcript_12884:64-813(+)
MKAPFLLWGIAHVTLNAIKTVAFVSLTSTSNYSNRKCSATHVSFVATCVSLSGTAAAAPAGPAFCERCGAPMISRIPSGDERARYCCTDPECGFVSYQNPKVVVGAVCTWEGRVLLCRRAIEPRRGRWGFPQGFLELGETTRAGAARETAEEAGADFDPAGATLLAVYNLSGAQVQMVYAAELTSGEIKAGVESLEVGFFAWEKIPWEDLAFPTVGWALEYARDFGAGSAVQQRTKYVDGNGEWRVEDG